MERRDFVKALATAAVAAQVVPDMAVDVFVVVSLGQFT